MFIQFKVNFNTALFILITLFIYLSQPISITVLRVRHHLLYRLFQFLWIHSHIPEGCNAKGFACDIIDYLIIVINDRAAITYLPVCQQRLRKATLWMFQQAFTLLQVFLMKIGSGTLTTHLVVIDKDA